MENGSADRETAERIAAAFSAEQDLDSRSPVSADGGPLRYTFAPDSGSSGQSKASVAASEDSVPSGFWDDFVAYVQAQAAAAGWNVHENGASRPEPVKGNEALAQRLFLEAALIMIQGGDEDAPPGSDAHKSLVSDTVEVVREAIDAPVELKATPRDIFSEPKHLSPQYWFEGIREAFRKNASKSKARARKILRQAEKDRDFGKATAAIEEERRGLHKWLSSEEPYRDLWREARGILWNRMRKEDKELRIQAHEALDDFGNADPEQARCREREDFLADYVLRLKPLEKRNPELFRVLKVYADAANAVGQVDQALVEASMALRLKVPQDRTREYLRGIERRYGTALDSLWDQLGGYVMRRKIERDPNGNLLFSPSRRRLS